MPGTEVRTGERRQASRRHRGRPGDRLGRGGARQARPRPARRRRAQGVRRAGRERGRLSGGVSGIDNGTDRPQRRGQVDAVQLHHGLSDARRRHRPGGRRGGDGPPASPDRPAGAATLVPDPSRPGGNDRPRGDDGRSRRPGGRVAAGAVHRATSGPRDRAADARTGRAHPRTVRDRAPRDGAGDRPLRRSDETRRTGAGDDDRPRRAVARRARRRCEPHASQETQAVPPRTQRGGNHVSGHRTRHELHTGPRGHDRRSRPGTSARRGAAGCGPHGRAGRRRVPRGTTDVSDTHTDRAERGEGTPVLAVESVESGYGEVRVLDSLSMHVDPGEIVCLVGPNGAGKSTVLKTVFGYLEPWSGAVRLRGRDIGGLDPHDVVREGVGYVPQVDNVFGALSVAENLRMGGVARESGVSGAIDDLYDRFPVLAEKRSAKAKTLSGGQRQILAFARALVMEPEVLLIDEPSAGLAPSAAETAFERVERVNETGTAVLMVEQNARAGLAVSDRGYVLDQGAVRHEGPAESLLEDPEVARLYLGG